MGSGLMCVPLTFLPANQTPKAETFVYHNFYFRKIPTKENKRDIQL